jgi:glycosyltransferase involved in cell wall biosynthesis
MPELISKAGLAMRMWFYRRAFNRSQKIFTVSEFSKSRIEYYSRHKVPVVVTHDAVHKKILKNSNVTGDKSETIVFLGNIKKHKGLDCLLEAFINAKACGLPHKLVIIGNKDNFRSADKDFLEKIESLGGDSVIFTGFVSDERLCEYLSCAALLVQPSLYEGFGLPPLEAMFLGTRALISDIPVFKEIYRDFPVTFFKAGDAEDLKQKLMELLLNRKPERIILSESLKSKYSFEKTAAVILQELPS